MDIQGVDGVFIRINVQLTFIRLNSSTNCSKSFPNNFFMLLILITIFFIKCTQRQMSRRDLFSNLMSQRIWWNWSVGCVSSLFLSGLLCIGCHPLTSPCCEPRAAQQRTDTLGVGRGPQHSYIEYQRYHFSGQIPTSSKIAAAAADKKNRLEVMSAFLRFFPFTLSLQSVCSWGVRKKLSSPFSPPSLPFVHQFLYRICKHKKQRIILS